MQVEGRSHKWSCAHATHIPPSPVPGRDTKLERLGTAALNDHMVHAAFYGESEFLSLVHTCADPPN